MGIKMSLYIKNIIYRTSTSQVNYYKLVIVSEKKLTFEFSACYHVIALLQVS